jgi:hypothetical protein
MSPQAPSKAAWPLRLGQCGRIAGGGVPGLADSASRAGVCVWRSTNPLPAERPGHAPVVIDHRRSSEQWHAEWTRDRQAAEAHLAAAAAAEPQPRLHEALARRAEVNAAILKLERALPIARSAQTDAQTRHDGGGTPGRQLLHGH